MSGYNFETIWKEMCEIPGPVVQEYNELEHVLSLVKGCSSYLEVGSAEGKTLFAFSKVLNNPEITYIDLGEKHTTPIRNEVIKKIGPVTAIHGNSNSWSTYEQVKGKRFDVVMIDAGHSIPNVLVDAVYYGPLAKKYVIFHDITIPDVKKTFDWYVAHMPLSRHYVIKNSEQFGYGIIEL